MDIREVLVDGIQQLSDWMEEALVPLTAEQVNFLPAGKTVSIGFNAWHITRTADNITNFVFQRQPPLWLREGYLEKFDLPKVEQGTGMNLEIARGIVIKDPALLRDYAGRVFTDTMAYVKTMPDEMLDEVQMIKPLGEMPKWRVVRQVMMTHGFMHLGEINAIKGMLGLQFAI